MENLNAVGIVTRSRRRLSVEKSDLKDDDISVPSTPTKNVSVSSTPTKKKTKRLSMKPELEDVAETDSDVLESKLDRINKATEENSKLDPPQSEVKKDVYKHLPIAVSPNLLDSPCRNLRKRNSSFTGTSPEGNITNSKTTPKKISNKKLENNMMQSIVDSPKPRKTKRLSGGEEVLQDTSTLRRSRRLSSELNIVVEDPIREEQVDCVQPITRRGKRLSVIPLQPPLPEECEDVKETENLTETNENINQELPNNKTPTLCVRKMDISASLTPKKTNVMENVHLSTNDKISPSSPKKLRNSLGKISEIENNKSSLDDNTPKRRSVRKSDNFSPAAKNNSDSPKLVSDSNNKSKNQKDSSILKESPQTSIIDDKFSSPKPTSTNISLRKSYSPKLNTSSSKSDLHNISDHTNSKDNSSMLASPNNQSPKKIVDKNNSHGSNDVPYFGISDEDITGRNDSPELKSSSQKSISNDTDISPSRNKSRNSESFTSKNNLSLLNISSENNGTLLNSGDLLRRQSKSFETVNSNESMSSQKCVDITSPMAVDYESPKSGNSSKNKSRKSETFTSKNSSPMLNISSDNTSVSSIPRGTEDTPIKQSRNSMTTLSKDNTPSLMNSSQKSIVLTSPGNVNNESPKSIISSKNKSRKSETFTSSSITMLNISTENTSVLLNSQGTEDTPKKQARNSDTPLSKNNTPSLLNSSRKSIVLTSPEVDDNESPKSISSKNKSRKSESFTSKNSSSILNISTENTSAPLSSQNTEGTPVKLSRNSETSSSKSNTSLVNSSQKSTDLISPKLILSAESKSNPNSSESEKSSPIFSSKKSNKHFGESVGQDDSLVDSSSTSLNSSIDKDSDGNNCVEVCDSVNQSQSILHKSINKDVLNLDMDTEDAKHKESPNIRSSLSGLLKLNTSANEYIGNKSSPKSLNSSVNEPKSANTSLSNKDCKYKSPKSPIQLNISTDKKSALQTKSCTASTIDSENQPNENVEYLEKKKLSLSKTSIKGRKSLNKSLNQENITSNQISPIRNNTKQSQFENAKNSNNTSTSTPFKEKEIVSKKSVQEVDDININQGDEANEDSSESEDSMHMEYLDSASDAGSNYESGDSMEDSEREEIVLNEIIEKGESICSDSSDIESDDSSYKKDSFVCSSNDESALETISIDSKQEKISNEKKPKSNKEKQKDSSVVNDVGDWSVSPLQTISKLSAFKKSSKKNIERNVGDFRVEAFDVENVTDNITNQTNTIKDNIKTERWTKTAGKFEIIKKGKKITPRPISVSDSGSTTAFNVVSLKKSPKQILIADSNMIENNFREQMLYGKSIKRTESSNVFKIRQKLQASKMKRGG